MAIIKMLLPLVLLLLPLVGAYTSPRPVREPVALGRRGWMAGVSTILLQPVFRVRISEAPCHDQTKLYLW